LRKRKTLEFRSEPFSDEKILGILLWSIFGREKPRNSVPNYFWMRKTPDLHFKPFLEEKKNLRIPFRIIFGREKTLEFRSEPILHNRKHSKIHSKPFLQSENTRKKTTFVSCFVKLHYFMDFHCVPFCSKLHNRLFRNTQNHTERALYSAEWWKSFRVYSTEFFRNKILIATLNRTWGVLVKNKTYF
jgi:hypothetical protein